MIDDKEIADILAKLYALCERAPVEFKDLIYKHDNELLEIVKPLNPEVNAYHRVFIAEAIYEIAGNYFNMIMDFLLNKRGYQDLDDFIITIKSEGIKSFLTDFYIHRKKSQGSEDHLYELLQEFNKKFYPKERQTKDDRSKK